MQILIAPLFISIAVLLQLNQTLSRHKNLHILGCGRITHITLSWMNTSVLDAGHQTRIRLASISTAP